MQELCRLWRWSRRSTPLAFSEAADGLAADGLAAEVACAGEKGRDCPSRRAKIPLETVEPTGHSCRQSLGQGGSI